MPAPPFLSVAFNQDGSAVVAGTPAGFVAYAVGDGGDVTVAVRVQGRGGGREGVFHGVEGTPRRPRRPTTPRRP
jgi:hypothetical protein